jgi:hypothetical protein
MWSDKPYPDTHRFEAEMLVQLAHKINHDPEGEKQLIKVVRMHKSSCHPLRNPDTHIYTYVYAYAVCFAHKVSFQHAIPGLKCVSGVILRTANICSREAGQ